MPFPRDCAERLHEQAYRTFAPQLQDLGEELQKVGTSLSSGITRLERRLEALRQIELPTAESILNEILGEVLRNKEREINTLHLFARRLREKETQEELLNLLLDTAITYFSCVVLYSVRGDRLIGWSSRGLTEQAARAVGADSFPCSEYAAFQEALEKENPAPLSDMPDTEPFRMLQDSAQGPWRLFPLMVLQKPAALLIAGGSEENTSSSEAVSTMTRFTALRLENTALRILNEIFASRPEAESTLPSEAVEVSSTAQPESVPDNGFEPVDTVQETGFSLQSPPDTPEAIRETGAQDEVIQPDPALQFDARNEIESPAAVSENGFSSWEKIEYTSADAAVSPEPEPSVQEPAAAALTPEEEKRHSDAKRFARLLVSEIKLYNENKVAEGRRHRDLFVRLKRDIEKSRDMYEKRVAADITGKIDYFHEELLRILGENDPSALGNYYPGPRTENRNKENGNTL
ncbi:MAG TPA: hypothetical protein VLL97_00240 [Acidobacteriota bacterium]|nr:hypothetical protein [Acidobacteriota bacterium]